MHMKLIRKRRNVFALFFILDICLMLLLGMILAGNKIIQ
jgi:hypothetical protein